MADSLSGQDKSNPALWLATQASKVALRIRYCAPQKSLSTHIINPYSQDSWVLASFFSFCLFMDLDIISVHNYKKAKQKSLIIQPS